MRGTAVVVVLIVALAVAIGVGIGAQERAMRRASARAADDFPLLIGAPGSQTQLVMTSVYLQIEAVPLVDGAVLNRLAADARVAGFAPIAFGDIVQGWPVIGTTAALVTRWGRVRPASGRVFEREGEAVVGAEVGLGLGETVTPSHGTAARGAEEEAAHRHEGVVYTVVGRLPRLGTPWDRAILIPIETVWETHGLGNGHASDDGPLGAPFDAKMVPGVPAVVVKPRGVADAYALRGSFRQGGTMAFFPAEVLVSLYQAMGDVRDVLVVAAGLNDIVVFLAVLLLAVTLAGLRRRRYAVLRALGASAGYVMLVAWLGVVTLILMGCLAGLAFGGGASVAISAVLAGRTGLVVVALPGWPEVWFVAGLFGVGCVMALVPAVLAGRAPVAAGLREGG